MNWKHWLYGLGAALIGGMATAVGGAVGAMAIGESVFSAKFWIVVGSAAGFGAITNAAAYLKQSPLPSPGTLTRAEMDEALKRIAPREDVNVSGR